MKKLILLIAVAAAGWQWFSQSRHAEDSSAAMQAPAQASKALEVVSRSYSCDGRIYCSQMTSCEEATYFLNNCPGTKMDGNHDGVPCEQQWCK
jgi:hypothetical protein